jgi:P27 family predicted phage terminase small subunit
MKRNRETSSKSRLRKEQIMGGQGSGRKPRPNHLKALEGSRHCNFDEPIPQEGIIVPPVELPADAQAVWNRLAPDLISRRVLSAWDVDAFSALCLSTAQYYRFAKEVEREGASTERPYKGQVASPAFRAMVAAEKMMQSLGARFGLTPADRAQLKVGGPDMANNPAARFLT